MEQNSAKPPIPRHPHRMELYFLFNKCTYYTKFYLFTIYRPLSTSYFSMSSIQARLSASFQVVTSLSSHLTSYWYLPSNIRLPKISNAMNCCPACSSLVLYLALGSRISFALIFLWEKVPAYCMFLHLLKSSTKQ